MPFAILSEDRKTSYTKDMELATIFCIAEMDRKKGVDFILRRSAEELNFIVEALYPIYLAPERNRTFIFDGFGFVSHTFSYHILPDVDTFINSLKRNSKNTQTYSTVLMQYIDYFDSFTGIDEREIKGLITDHEFNVTIFYLLDKAQKITKPISNKIILSPSINEKDVYELINDIAKIRKDLQDDIKKLQKTMSLLNKLTEKHLDKKQKEIKNVEAKYEERISKTKKTVTKKVDNIQLGFKKKITAFMKRFNAELQNMLKEEIKLQKRLEDLSKQEKKYEDEIKEKNVKGEVKKVRNLMNELAKISQQREDVKKELEAVRERIDAMNKRKDAEVSKLNLECKSMVESVLSKVDELEAERNAKMKMREDIILSLQEHTAVITDKIDKLLDAKKRALVEFEELGINKKLGRMRLVYLPLYIICFKRKGERRYSVIPISTIRSMRTLTKFKSLIGLSGIKSILKPFQKIEELINEFSFLLSSNPAFETEIFEMGEKLNLLKTNKNRELIKDGLAKLEAEGWFSERELYELKKTLDNLKF